MLFRNNNNNMYASSTEYTVPVQPIPTPLSSIQNSTGLSFTTDADQQTKTRSSTTAKKRTNGDNKTTTAASVDSTTTTTTPQPKKRTASGDSTTTAAVAPSSSTKRARVVKSEPDVDAASKFKQMRETLEKELKTALAEQDKPLTRAKVDEKVKTKS